MRIIKNIVIILILIVTASCTTLKDDKQTYLENPDYRLILSSGVDSNDDPIDNLEEISLANEKLVIYTTWFNIPTNSYSYSCKIYDSSGQKVKDSNMDFNPTSDEWYTWSTFYLNPNTDKAGKWKMELFLDGVIVIEKEFDVIEASYETANTED